MNSAGKARTTMTIGIGALEPPYVYDDVKNPGVLVKLLLLVARNLDLDIEFKQQRFSQRLRMIEMNELDGATYVSFTEERMKIGVFPMKDGKPDPSRRTMTIGYHFYKLKDSPFMWDGETFHSLNGSICAEKGAVIVDVLRAKGVTVKEFKDPPECLSKVAGGDAVAYVELGTWTNVYISNEPEKFRDVVKIPTPIRENPYYLMLSHKFVKEQPQLAEQIWNEIGRLREDKLKIFEDVYYTTFQELQASQRKLQQAHDTLEIRVRERTIELARAKEVAEAVNRSKSDFLSNMSHELRTPLNAILGFSQLMQRDPALTTDQKSNLGIINRSGEHLLALINDVLEMSKIEAGRTTLNENDFDLYRLLDDLEHMFRLQAIDKGLRLYFQCAPDVPQYIRTDESKLRQVIINLLSNAIKFTEQGEVRLEVSELSELEFRKTHKTLHFKVEDTGPGIAPNELDSVFEPFVQTESGRQSQRGTGLGMPISYQFVQLMGGQLRVASTVEQGTAFRFDIQISQLDAAEVQTEQPIRRVIGLEPDQLVYRLLIVDDEVDNRKLLIKLLEPLAFELREASNGQECIEMWQQWQPDLIWMDMRMPVMDGYEATERIRAASEGLPTIIIALTASAFEDEREKALAIGCDDFVRKPFHEAEIFDKMAAHLGVRYLYGEESIADSVQTRASGQKPLVPTDLTALPPELLADLRQAIIELNLKKANIIIEQISHINEPLAQSLAYLVEDFRFDTLQALVEDIK